MYNMGSFPPAQNINEPYRFNNMSQMSPNNMARSPFQPTSIIPYVNTQPQYGYNVPQQGTMSGMGPQIPQQTILPGMGSQMPPQTMLQNAGPQMPMSYVEPQTNMPYMDTQNQVPSAFLPSKIYYSIICFNSYRS